MRDLSEATQPGWNPVGLTPNPGPTQWLLPSHADSWAGCLDITSFLINTHHPHQTRDPRGQGPAVLQSLNLAPQIPEEGGVGGHMGAVAYLWTSGATCAGVSSKNARLTVTPGWSVSESPHAHSPGSGKPGKWGVFPGSIRNKQSAEVDEHSPHTVPQLSARLSQQTRAAPGGAPASLNCHPHPNGLGLRLREPGAWIQIQHSRGARASRTIGSLPVTSPTHRAPCSPPCPLTWLQHFLIHSTHPLCPRVLGTRNPPRHCLPLGSQAGRWTQNLTMTASGTGPPRGSLGEEPDAAPGRGH